MNTVKALIALAKINKVLKREDELIHMKLTTTTVLQLLAGIIQILNIILPLTQGETKLWVAAVVAIIQIIINTISHLSNPDGTSVRTAYIPKGD